MIDSDMKNIMNKASSDNGGRIDPATLSDIELELLEQYLFCQETWQEVCLVIEKDDNVGTSSTVVINRPLSTKASVSVHATYIIPGAQFSEIDDKCWTNQSFIFI